MAKSFRQFLKGILIRGETSDPSDNLNGSLWYNSTSNRLKGYLESAIRVIVSEDQTQTLTNKTLSGNTASNLVNGSGTLNINSTGTVTVPNATDTLVGKATTDTLTNKTIDGDNNTVQDLALTSLKTVLADASKFVVRDASGIPVSNTKDVPSGVVVGTTDTQTLTNKTLTGNTAVNLVSGSGTLILNTSGTATVPNATDTLVGKATTDVLTNKTIDGDDNTVQDLALTSLKTNLTDASKFIVRDASGIPVSNTKAVPSGDVVGTSDTQTLSAKTFSDAPILAEIATPSTPSSGYGKIYFKSDGFLYQLNDDGTETKVGAGAGGINYITNSDLESNVTGYVAYSDAAGVAPVDGTGGSPTVTATRSTSSPLRGTGSLLLTKDAANRQGEGISYDFSIATADKGKVLQASFEYAIASGTFADDDVRMYIYDVTNSTLIYPTPYLLKNHTLSAEKFGFEFQTSSSSTSYRLIFHVASTSASAYTLKFDTISIGPQAKLYGSPVTDWISTPVPSSAITNMTRDGYAWKRIGDECIIQLSGTFSGASSLLNITPSQLLPNGLSLDTTKIIAYVAGANNDASPIGEYEAVDNGVGANRGVMTYNKTGNVFNLWNVAADTAIFTPGSGDGVTFYIRVPILGWSSSAIMSNDADTRVIVAQVTGNPASASSGNPIIFPTISFDTHAAYNNSTGRYIVPVSGYYKLYGAMSTANAAVGLNIYKNASIGPFVGFTDSNGEVTFGGLIQANAGDILDLRPGATLDADGSSSLNFEKISGPSQIAASEKVYAKYETQSAGSYPTASTTVVDFTTKIDDSHGAVTTGASWKFTAPRSGRARVNAQVQVAAMAGWAAGEFVNLQLQKNTVFQQYLVLDIQTATHSTDIFVNGYAEINLNAGDTLTVALGQNNGSTAALITAQPGTNLISISMD